MPTILAIETSCDETAVAVVTGADRPTVVVNEISSQIPLHQLTGGVVPEVAAREQAKVMLPVLEHALAAAAKQGITRDQIDTIAYTKEPGLIGSLLVGRETAETLAALWQKSALPLHHVQAHIYGALANLAPTDVQFPAVVLVVSGGHTQLWLMPDHLQFQLLGTTRDDAAGEAFDKIARLLGLLYPGGPSIAACAATADPATKIEPFPRPMLHDQSSDFSFSGLKTAVYYRARGREIEDAERALLASEAQRAIVDVLIGKTIKAAAQQGVKTVILAGGVAANKLLREELTTATKNLGLALLIPDFSLCTDNAGMVGVLGWYQYSQMNS